jgi:hypothetical protein
VGLERAIYLRVDTRGPRDSCNLQIDACRPTEDRNNLGPEKAVYLKMGTCRPRDNYIPVDRHIQA